MDYDIESASVERRRRADPRHRGPDDRAAASRGLGRGARDGPARRLPAADGRALRPRRPRHPAHRHPCLPALSPRPPAAALPHTWRPFGVRMAGDVLGGGLLVVCALAWIGFDDETRAQVHRLPARHRVALGLLAFTLWFALVRSPGGRRGRAAGRRQRLPAPRVRVGAGGRRAPAAGRALGDPRPRRRHHRSPAMGIQGSDGDRAERRCASCAPSPSSRPLGRDLGRTIRSARSRVPCRAKCSCSATAQASQYGANASPSRSIPRRIRTSRGASTQTSTVTRSATAATPTRRPRRPAAARARRAPSRRTRRRASRSAGSVPGRPAASGRSSPSSWASTVGQPAPALEEVVHVHDPASRARARRPAAASVVLPGPRRPVDAEQPPAAERRGPGRGAGRGPRVRAQKAWPHPR